MITFNPDLVNDLIQRKVVLFLGSGVSASATVKAGAPMKQWPDFLKHAAELIPDSTKKKYIDTLISTNDYLMACEVLRNALDDRWSTILIDEFSRIAEPSDLHKEIVKLDQRIIMTTNFDKTIENTWSCPDISVTHHPILIHELGSSAFKMLRDNNCYIVKIHGSIDKPETIVFTKENYSKYAYGSWEYRELLAALLLTHTFLFIGFSMNDPAISLIVETHAQKFPDTRPHYIFMGGDVSPDVVDVYKKLRKLYIIPYNTDNNHSQLVEYMTELNNEVRRRKNESI